MAGEGGEWGSAVLKSGWCTIIEMLCVAGSFATVHGKGGETSRNLELCLHHFPLPVQRVNKMTVNMLSLTALSSVLESFDMIHNILPFSPAEARALRLGCPSGYTGLVLLQVATALFPRYGPEHWHIPDTSPTHKTFH